jgi:hypothetical protein
VGGFGPLACVEERPQVRLMYLILYYFLHTKIEITKQILTFRSRKYRGRFFELFESTAERNEGWASIEGSERCGGGTKKLVLCWGRNQFAKEQTVMATDDWRASVGG